MENPRREGERVLPLLEEELRLEKRQVSAGTVRVNTVSDVVEEIVSASLEYDSVEINRVQMNTVVAAPPPIRTEGDLTIIPVLKEVLHVEKRLVLTEELHVRLRTKTENVEVPVSLRKQRATVESVAPDHQPSDKE